MCVRATISARGMKELDWSAFGSGLVQAAAGSGHIDAVVPATSLAFYAGLFLRLGAEARIESPDELVARVCGEAQAVLSLYSSRSWGAASAADLC